MCQTDDECRLTEYLSRWPLLSVQEARRELGLLDGGPEVAGQITGGVRWSVYLPEEFDR